MTGAKTMEKIRVLIADDHPLFRDGLRTLLTSAPDFEMAGEATTGEEAVELALQVQPDIILMDLQMPGMGGIEATRRIAATLPHVGVLVVTMFEDDLSVMTAIRAGARGYLVKGAKHADFLRSIRAVAAGDAVFGAAIARRVMEYFAELRPRQLPTLFPELSDREREVLSLMAQGESNGSIASRLYLSPKTVRNYVTTILDKLQATDRAEAIIRARNAGLG
jgi:DNA-binding NarL/FixJ family response regulator